MDNTQDIFSAEWYREQGKMMFFKKIADLRSGVPVQESEDPKTFAIRISEIRSQGLEYLIKAHNMGDMEASFIVANLILQKMLTIKSDDPEEHALKILHSLADKGDLSSRELLNRICISKYTSSINNSATNANSKGLVDFQGKPIRIDRKGVLTPIDAELEYTAGRNVLNLRANIAFFYLDELPDESLFKKAVLDGIMAWEGEYTVFGGQPLSVRIHLTTEVRLFDNVIVLPVTESYENALLKVTKIIPSKTKEDEMKELIHSKRSFATVGLKWSVNSRKIICMQSENNDFTDYDELKAVATHEFGHALGLGDLYYSPSDNLSGVEKGNYFELDSFYVSDKIYNLVMCDHHGIISNNDIEMILLAFRENKMQLYQKSKRKDKISKALGKGN